MAIARALINQPQFIIADEPTGALDTKTSAAIMAILTNLHKEQGVTIIMVTHDPRIRQFASRHITIVDGVVQAASQDYDQNQLGYLPGDRLTTIDLTGKESRVNDALK